MPTHDGTEDYRNNPEPVFHTELNAVAARRRRFRIERILGRLPDTPEPFPKPERLPSIEPQAQAVPVPPNATAPIPTVDSLKSLGEATRAARKKLADKRNALAEPLDAHDPATGEFKEAASAKTEAEEYYNQAKIWYEAAKAYRDVILEHAGNNAADAAAQARLNEAEAILDEAEAILRVAVRNLAEAANEVRRERESSRSALIGDTRAPSQEVANRYGQVLAWELEVQKLLETTMPPCPAKLADARHQLALAEHKLFEVAHDSERNPEIQADCKLARDAAQEEVQRWQRERNLNKTVSCSPVPPCPDLEGTKGGPPIPEIRVREHALDMDLVGLCLSGGGIRSATFGLGMLQGLAQLRLLGAVDMLSTVSGGGYIGSWLTAWIQREKSLTNVEKQLSPNRVSQAEAERFQVMPGTLKDIALDDLPRDAEPEPVHHLRAYSRYLSPRFGAFSPDTWSLFAIYFRNLFVNSLFFVPLAVVVVFAWILLLNGFIPPPAFTGATVWEGLLTTRFALSAVFLLAFGAAVVNWVREQENLFEADLNAPELQATKRNPWSQHWGILFPLFLVALVGPWIFDLDRRGNMGKSYDQASKLRYFGQTTVEQILPGLGALLQFASCFGALCLGLVLFVQFVRWRRRCHLLKRKAPFNVHGTCASCTFAVFFGLFFYLAMDLVVWRLSYAAMEGELVAGKPIQLANYCLLHSVGVPLVFVALILAGYVEMALVGLWLSEFEREWRSRISAYLSMGATAWLLFAVAIFLIPWLIDILPGMIVKQWPHGARAAVKSVFTALWAAISGGGAWAAWNSGKQPGRQPGWISWALMNVAPSVFLLGLLACVSLFGQNLLGFIGHNRLVGDFITAQTPVPNDRWQFLNHTVTETANYGIAMLFAAALTLLFGFFVSVNPFSLHMLYANRLTRCYLGASRRKEPAGGLGTPTGVREPSPVRFANLFTGFDPSDDLPISDLRTVDESVHYAGPLPLLNCALNRVAGGELAVQDRQADAFLITPQWCGGALTGYVRTPGISRKEKVGNLSLGRSLTISGAAVDPNMNGLSPPLTALMTLLNTRLGWWLEHPNPERRATFSQVPTLSRGTWPYSQPGLGLQLMREFLGLTNENSPYVHLSDGGHFENLGVYELIRRRCRFIIVSDAGVDRLASSDNMAAMLQLIRTDLGVRIDLDTKRMQIGGDQSFSLWHCCVGRIHYDEVDRQGLSGILVYVQATLTGDEPPDLLQYVARHPAFPRQSTLDQFFDETQFEAYRVLGQHTALQVFGQAASSWSGAPACAADHQEEARAVFALLREQWLPPVDCSPAEVLTVAKAALHHDQFLGNQWDLREFSNSLYSEISKLRPGPQRYLDLPEFRAISQTMQIMEMAWSTMKLGSYHAHPINRGWMNTFRRWTSSEAFHRYWPVLRAQYSRPFGSFCEDILNLQPTQTIHTEVPLQSPNDALEKLQKELPELDKQLTQEWAAAFDELDLPMAAFPRQGFLQDFLAQAQKPQDSFPRCWTIHQQAEGSPQAKELICGVACLAATKRQQLLEPNLLTSASECEFFFWMRGPYRSMGIGRHAVKEILRRIDEESVYMGAAPIRKLVVYYPLRSANSGATMELQRWMDFCFDLGFRRVKHDQRGPSSKIVILKRKVR